MSICCRFCSMLPTTMQPGRLRQPPELVQGIVGRHVAMGKDHPDQNGSFLTPRTLDAIVSIKAGFDLVSSSRSEWIDVSGDADD